LDIPDEPLDIPVSILSDGNEISADNSFELLEDDGNLAPNKRNSSVPETEVSDTVADFANAEDLPAETLSLQLLDEQVYRGGERLSLKIVVYRRGNEPVSDAEIVVKVLGSAFRPQIFHAQTDPHGLAIVHLQLPHFRSGRAAILIRAVSNGYEAELRRIVTQS
jgi:hypothetical protein